MNLLWIECLILLINLIKGAFHLFWKLGKCTCAYVWMESFLENTSDYTAWLKCQRLVAHNNYSMDKLCSSRILIYEKNRLNQITLSICWNFLYYYDIFVTKVEKLTTSSRAVYFNKLLEIEFTKYYSRQECWM